MPVSVVRAHAYPVIFGGGLSGIFLVCVLAILSLGLLPLPLFAHTSIFILRASRAHPHTTNGVYTHAPSAFMTGQTPTFLTCRPFNRRLLPSALSTSNFLTAIPFLTCATQLSIFNKSCEVLASCGIVYCAFENIGATKRRHHPSRTYYYTSLTHQADHTYVHTL